jgi:hypothetical protein
VDKKEFFLRLYDSRNAYHDQKDRLIWLAASTYIAAIAAATAWLVLHADAWIRFFPLRWIPALVLAVVTGLSTWFVWKQNLGKAEAAFISKDLEMMIGKFGTSAEPSFKRLDKALNVTWNKLCRGDKRQCMRQLGMPGWIMVGLLVGVGITATYVLFRLAWLDP